MAGIKFYKDKECTQIVGTGDQLLPSPRISIFTPSTKTDEMTIYAKITDLAATFYPHVTLLYDKRKIEYLGLNAGGVDMKIFEVTSEGKDALELSPISGSAPLVVGECYAFSGSQNPLRVDRIEGNKVKFTDEEDLSYIKKGEFAFKLLPLVADKATASEAVHAVKLVRRVSFADVSKGVSFGYYIAAYWSGNA